MKKIFAVALVAFVAFSCQKEVEFNSPALQGNMNNIFWKASNLSATKASNGHITIMGQGKGDLMLELTSSGKGTYTLGTTNRNNRAQFTQKDATGQYVYATDLFRSPVNNVSLLYTGSGYSDAVSVSTSGGSGIGLKVNIKVNTTGNISSVEVANPGDDYLPGDVVTITAGNLNAKLTVVNTSVSNGEIAITDNTGGTITGTYKFTAYDSAADKTMVSREGIFYKIPVQ